MIIIGTFGREGDSFTGYIQSLTLDVARVHIDPVEKSSAHAPDYRLRSGQCEFGAAWSKKAKGGGTLLRVQFSDPVLSVKVYAWLIETSGDRFVLFLEPRSEKRALRAGRRQR
jgi:uncharacterized protein (DUF736 family)